MSLVAVEVSDGDFKCSYGHIVSAIVDGRAKLLLVTSSAPSWIRAELKRLADTWHCPLLCYDHSVIEIRTSQGNVVHVRFIAFTDVKAASDILTLSPY